MSPDVAASLLTLALVAAANVAAFMLTRHRRT